MSCDLNFGFRNENLENILKYFLDRFGRSGMAQYARSEAELEQIMDGLHEQEVCHYANMPM